MTSLQPFNIDDCIEQFNRGNWPGYKGVELELFLGLLKCWLIELKAQREVSHVLNCKMLWLHRENCALTEKLALAVRGFECIRNADPRPDLSHHKYVSGFDFVNKQCDELLGKLK